MPFPHRLLGEDEEVVLDLHPHWKQLLVPVALIPIVIGIATYVWAVLPSGSAQTALRWAVVAIAVLLLLRFSLWPFLKWQTTHYVLTTRRVIIRQGVFGRSGRDVPLTRVNDVSFQHSLLERMLRCGTLTIESAGEHGQVVLPEVPKVELVQREVYRCVEAEVRRQGGPWREPTADGSS
ncbi:MAG: hypothetical protein QOF18_2407 [Frankiaceae bacterium]|jgi:uncharacterized membrane protein YdbT with pleckstrin-like domain|nr:hypothetical protein [Frankiaceae bacterium]